MNWGTMLFSIAIAAMVAAWVARPFRPVSVDQNRPARQHRVRSMLFLGLLLALGVGTVILAIMPRSTARSAAGEIGLGLVALSLGIGIARLIWNMPGASSLEPGKDETTQP